MRKLEIIIPKLNLEKLVEIFDKHEVEAYAMTNLIDARLPGGDRSYISGIVPADDKVHVDVYTKDPETIKQEIESHADIKAFLF